MNQFELKSECVYLIEKLKKSLDLSNLIKLSIDVKLPRFYSDNPLTLTSPIEQLSTELSKLIVNGIITIDIKKWSDSEERITLHVSMAAANVSNLTEELKASTAERFSNIESEFKGTIYDLSHTLYPDLATCVFKIDLHPTYKQLEPTRRLPLEGKKILIVEDNEINAMVFSSFLDEWGCQNQTAVNGLVGVELAQDSSFDLILMDIYMPVLNGIEATRAIRKFNPNVPIIALTASTLESDSKEAWEAGVNDLLLKPVSSSSLFKVITTHI